MCEQQELCSEIPFSFSLCARARACVSLSRFPPLSLCGWLACTPRPQCRHRQHVYRFDTAFGLDAASTKAISDHYPVFVHLNVSNTTTSAFSAQLLRPANDGPTRTTLRGGSVAVTVFHADNINGSDVFAVVLLHDVAAGTEMKVTDNGWDCGTQRFRAGEGRSPHPPLHILRAPPPAWNVCCRSSAPRRLLARTNTAAAAAGLAAPWRVIVRTPRRRAHAVRALCALGAAQGCCFGARNGSTQPARWSPTRRAAAGRGWQGGSR